ncbi:Hypothetical predicted protein [Paramuricea clavata]|uniref:Uncharacterized protein n=1 Tax=Paramuricea clavata TaxID=317549 RepID=A0A6S7JKS5_PARCT|nr:Hypothetical predicted protein [Paramuricea clavata]
MLTVLHITNLIPIVTTAIIGIIPHLFNMEALKMSEERKKAREEKLKLIVKRRVDELVRKKPKLARIVLIIVQDNDTKDKENIERYGHVKSGFDLNTPEYEKRLQENDDATTDENVKIYKYVVASSDLNTFDSDSLPFVTVHSPPATKTPMRADDRTVDDRTADDRTADDTTADDRTADDTTADDTTADDTTADDTTADDTTADGRTADDTTADDTTADDTTADDTTADDTTPDGRTVDDTTADGRTMVISPGLNPSDNADVDDPELAGTVTRQEYNDTTHEENIQDYERVEGFELDLFDNDYISSEHETLILRETSV